MAYRRPDGERGQAALLLLGATGFVLVGALILGAIAAGVGKQGGDQRAADLAALAGARAMRASYFGLFTPPDVQGVNGHVEKAVYLAQARAVALTTAHRNGAHAVDVSFPDEAELAPVRIRVTVSDPARVRLGPGEHSAAIRAVAVAELAPPGGGLAGFTTGGGYHGPLAYRQGKPMRPDVALAFDRMATAAGAAGISLIVVSGYRSDAEQAALFAAHPDPK